MSGSSPLRSDGPWSNQTGGWTTKEAAKKALKAKLAQWPKSTQIRWFSWWSGGRLDLVRGGQRHSRENRKTTLESQGTYCSQKTGIVTASKRVNLLFFRVNEKGRWCYTPPPQMMKMMMRCEPVCHKAEWQWHAVLGNCSSSRSICI
jgi:hypothetical protein